MPRVLDYLNVQCPMQSQSAGRLSLSADRYSNAWLIVNSWVTCLMVCRRYASDMKVNAAVKFANALSH
jgi:hypothetical protein